MKDKQFYKDLHQAKAAEQLCLAQAAKLFGDSWIVEDVSDVYECRHKGDIRVTNKETGEIKYIDVKDDKVIAKTGNINCEHEVYWKDCDYYQKGYMFSEYNELWVVSKQEKIIYRIDFKVLQKHYKKGELKFMDHPTQFSECYLVGIWQAKQWGALIEKIRY